MLSLCLEMTSWYKFNLHLKKSQRIPHRNQSALLSLMQCGKHVTQTMRESKNQVSDQSSGVKDLIDEFPKEMVFVKKVLGLDSLRKKHAKFEQQRALLARFDIFMADDRIIPMVGKAIGKHFFATKKQPIPVRLTRKATLPLQIVNALRATYWYLSEGTCLSVKAGTTAMSPENLVVNILHIATQLPEKLPRKWANIRSISVKTSDSMSLPFYNKTPFELQEIAKLAGLDDKEVAVENGKTKDMALNEEGKEINEKAEKKRKKKSPLLRALKRQQEQNNMDEIQNKKFAKRQKTTEKETTGKQTVVENEQLLNAEDCHEEESKTKMPIPDADGVHASRQKQGTSEKQRKERAPNCAKTSVGKASTNEPSSGKGKTDKETFIPGKKFNGSREGYVFKMGTNGLGYYLDVKPVADPLLLEALGRMAKRPSSVKKKK
eukprot:CAMPEP_0178919482 /NCGR_PEP_ID=MMETSP0786-20121207/14461_1 /TAXON_ID=186022 /ORGANISM="Thalassionema frauenfeldii, Strain CCMP 1798" /LENGTH=433 /DNA_ID=CAMNT_0020593417 /DNA_START=27 /DNA_END=1324 /DNA_ORIENTATION=+